MTGGRTGNEPYPSGQHFADFPLTGTENAGTGIDSAYVNKIHVLNLKDRPFRIFDRNTPSDLNVGSTVWASGFYVFTWNLPEFEEDCKPMPVWIPTVVGGSQGWEPGDSEDPICVPNITQSGGGPGPSNGDGPSPTDADFTPQNQLNPDGSNPSLPGRPLVAGSNNSGAQLWWHKPITPNTPGSYIEVRHWDGTVATYVRLPGIGVERLDASGAVVREGDVWKLDKTTDPFDNVTQYTYDQSGQLVLVSYPNGIFAHWNWSQRGRTTGPDARESRSVTPPASIRRLGVRRMPNRTRIPPSSFLRTFRRVSGTLQAS